MHILSTDSPANVPGSPTIEQGGLARFSAQLADYLKKSDHQYTGIIIRKAEISQPKVKTVYKRASTQFIDFAFPAELARKVRKAEQPINPSVILNKTIESIREQLRILKPDVVLINGMFLSPWLLLKAAYQEGIPVVQLHAGILHIEVDTYAEYYTTHAAKASKQFEKDAASLATKQIFLNSYSEDVFQKKVKRTPKSKRCIIPLPTPFNKSSKRQTKDKKPSKTIHVGLVARWDRIKNHNAVLALAEEITAQKLAIKLHVITTILESDKLLKMKERYRELINIHEPTDSDGILKFFRSMDIAILPSLFDVSPTVVLEAASQGVGTIISPSVGWVNHYRKTGNSAWVGDFSKPKAIIKKIEKLAGTSLSTKLINLFEKEHDPEKIFKQYINLFKSLI